MAEGDSKGVGAAANPANRAGSAIETAQRHQRVVQMKLRGKSDEAISAETGLAPRSVQDVWKKWRESEKIHLVEEDPIEVVLEHIAGFRDLRALAAEVYDQAGGTELTNEGGPTIMYGQNSNARVGALRLMMELRSKEIDLRQETGLLPKNLGKLQVELDVRWIVEQIAQLIVKYDMPPEAQDELLALLERGEPAAAG